MKNKERFYKLLIAGILIVSLIIGWFFGLRKGVWIGDAFYYRINESTYKSLSGYEIMMDENDHVSFHLPNDQNYNLTVTNTDDTCTVTLPDGTVRTYTVSSDTIRNEKGEPLWTENVEFSISTGDEPVHVSQNSLIESAIRIKSGNLTRRSGIIIMLLGLVFYTLGILTICFPENMAFLLNRWRYNRVELSDSGILLERLGGGFLALTGIGLMTGIILYFIA